MRDGLSDPAEREGRMADDGLLQRQGRDALTLGPSAHQAIDVHGHEALFVHHVAVEKRKQERRHKNDGRNFSQEPFHGHVIVEAAALFVNRTKGGAGFRPREVKPEGSVAG